MMPELRDPTGGLKIDDVPKSVGDLRATQPFLMQQMQSALHYGLLCTGILPCVENVPKLLTKAQSLVWTAVDTTKDVLVGFEFAEEFNVGNGGPLGLLYLNHIGFAFEGLDTQLFSNVLEHAVNTTTYDYFELHVPKNIIERYEARVQELYGDISVTRGAVGDSPKESDGPYTPIHIELAAVRTKEVAQEPELA